MVNKLNDSLGFDYFCYDSSSVQKIEQNIRNGSSYIDSLASILNKTTSSISDFEKGTSTEERSRQFAMNTLKYRWMTHYASSDGKVKPVQNPLGIGYVPTQNGYFSFHTKPNPQP